MNVKKRMLHGAVYLLGLMMMGSAMAEVAKRVPPWAHNQLVDAKVSGNMESYDQGLRGKAGHVVYDVVHRKFNEKSTWHEYGIGAGKTLGIVSEDTPVFWMAEWSAPVTANLIRLRGAYPNQPQPDTAWKIEVRRDGAWQEHARGVGGWYNNGHYVWHVPMKEGITFDAFRVALFSKDDKTPLNSVHFRGEPGTSWVVASVADLDGRMHADKRRIRLGEPVTFLAEGLAGQIKEWSWDLGDGTSAKGTEVRHTYGAPGSYVASVDFTDGEHVATLKTAIEVGPPILAGIANQASAIMAGHTVVLDGAPSQGEIAGYSWQIDEGPAKTGQRIEHRFDKPGLYTARLTVEDGTYSDSATVLLRVHNEKTVGLPQLLLDSDQKNEQDDQYFLGYAIFSELDLLGINSVHHGGGQEEINYNEIVHVEDLARQSGAVPERIPQIFRGADVRLEVPGSGVWSDTLPIVNEAAEAILATARGASPDNPAWIVPVGPGTNVASALLMAREEGIDLHDRIRIMWLGGSNKAIINEFNGNNDPWSLYVIAESGVDLWIMPAPVGARVKIDKRTEADLYADHPLGAYLKKITPAKDKALYDPAVLGAIIDIHMDFGWVKEVEPVTVSGPMGEYRWHHSDTPTNVKVIREIDQAAIKADIFNTLKGTATSLQK